MYMKQNKKKLYLQSKKRYLKKIVGTEERPRLSVFRSNNHIYGQIINDKRGFTFCSLSSLSKPFLSERKKNTPKNMALNVGKRLGELALQKNITKIVFDNGSRIYHGRIQSFAEGIRLAGVLF